MENPKKPGIQAGERKAPASPKKKRQIHRWIRASIQVLFFLFFSSAFTAAFGGVKYIAAQIGAGERVEWTAFTVSLAALCAYTVVFGRFFCGFACAFGSLGDGAHALFQWACKKCGKKPVKLGTLLCAWLASVKYVVLAVIVVCCFRGVYGDFQGSSPWDVFSMLHAGNFHFQGYRMGLLALAVILVGMCLQERFFCRFLCPMGAVFSMLPVLPVFSLRRDRGICRKGCSACTRKCPSDLEVPQEGSYEVPGDCFQCQKCVEICPGQNIHCGASRELRGSEAWFTLLRAGLLLALYILIGI